MEEYDEAALFAEVRGCEGFEVMELSAIAEGAEAMREAVWALVEVPELGSGYERLEHVYEGDVGDQDLNVHVVHDYRSIWR